MRVLALLLLILLPFGALAQEDDRGYLTGLLEDSLGGEGRSVRIDGFAGALSSRATIDRITISDAQGVWLTMEGVALEWNRSALLRGRIEIAELSARSIALPRLPEPVPSETPSAASQGFSLPELPVSVEIGALNVASLTIGAPVIGQEARLRMAANASLIDGRARTGFTAERIDGALGRFVLDFDYTQGGALELSLQMSEGDGGIAASQLGLPAVPALDLSISGQGTAQDFDGTLTLASDGAPRVAGALRLTAEGEDTAIAADLNGDIAALLAPRYRPFFGEAIALRLRGTRTEDGALTLPDLVVSAQALEFNGSVALNADYWPTALTLNGRIASTDGAPVLLPIAGDETRVSAVDLALDYDAAEDDRWSLTAAITGLDTAALRAESLRLSGTGTLRAEVGEIGQVSGGLRFAAAELAPSDASLAAALGAEITGGLVFRYVEDQPFEITDLSLTGDDYGLSGDVTLAGLNADFAVTLDTSVDAQDLSRFAGLAGQALEGEGVIALAGSADLGGAFDLRLSGRTRGLAIGQAQADAVLSGQTDLSLRAIRNTEGTRIEGLSLSNPQITATGSAALTETAGTVQFDARLAEAAILSPELEGPLTLTGQAERAGPIWSVDLTVAGPFGATAQVNGPATGPAPELRFTASLPDLSQFVADLSGSAVLTGTAARDGADWRIAADVQAPYGIAAQVQTVLGEAPLTASFSADVPELSRIPQLAEAVPELRGAARLTGTADQSDAGIAVQANVEGPYAVRLEARSVIGAEPMQLRYTLALPEVSAVPQIKAALPDLTGAFRSTGTATQVSEGWRISATAAVPYDVVAQVDTVVGVAPLTVEFAARAPDVARVPQVSALGLPLSGPMALSGAAQQGEAGWTVDLSADGPLSSTAKLRAETAQDLRLTYDLTLGRTEAIVAQLPGASRVQGTAVIAGEVITLDAAMTAAYGLTVSAEGRVTGSAPDLQVSFALPNVAPLVPGVSGPLSASGRLQQKGESLRVEAQASGPYGATARVSGPISGTTPDVQFSLRLPNVAALVPELSGALDVTGSARQNGNDWALATQIEGPAGASGQVSGQVTGAGQADLSLAGTLPLALANPFLSGQQLRGTARYDLQLRGSPGLEALSGQVTVQEGRLAAPNLRLSLFPISADLRLAQGRAVIDATARNVDGGRATVQGSLGLSGGYPAQLAVALQRFRLADPSLYTTRLSGDLTLAGPLTGGARISGALALEETQLTVPSATTGGFAIVPQIAHVDMAAGPARTLERSGLNESAAEESDGGGGAAYPLDVTISAPSRIFVRGRGLDAELGGQLRLTGTTAAMISAGRFDLQRGRLDILSKRFTLDEGTLQLQGDFDPYLRFVATTDTDAGSASVILSGLASDPQVTFESTPAAPQDEVLAQIFFGKDATQLSAFQALQLASAVNTLAGRGGEGLVSRLRQGLDLDDLDITTGDSGETELRAGKYISENVYSEVTVGSETSVSINVDLTPNLTAKGTLSSDGDTSIGIYFEKDY